MSKPTDTSFKFNEGILHP